MSLASQNLDSHRWNHRVIIINADILTADEFEKQLEVFRKNENKLIERKLIIYQITNNTLKQGISKNSKWKPIEATLVNQWKEFNQIGVTLIGLDGGIKLRQSDILEITHLLNAIDMMPMRRSEIESKDKG